jgi:hypothetical protein
VKNIHGIWVIDENVFGHFEFETGR